MAWRVAKSLLTLRAQIDALYPNRSKASDGTIGDADHQKRNSDHNPWYGPGIVTAMDITHDPAHGVDIDRLTDELVASRDTRIKYIIANGMIIDSRPGNRPWQWVRYTGGPNPHTAHFHLSVMPDSSADDTRPWNLPSLGEGAPMLIYGVDIHPRYQAGINIEQIRREGFDFMAVKVSERTDSSFMAAGSADFLRRGKAAGLLCLGYHYLRAGNEDEQARVFAAQLRAAGVPGMLDAEDGAGDIRNIRAFIDACRRYDAPVPLMYLPRWYWERIGRPDLQGLPPLWASRYVSGDSRPASTMYAGHNPAGWESYGGLPVAVLQFTDKAAVAGYRIDADAYRGTREQFATLIDQEENMPSAQEIADAVWDQHFENVVKEKVAAKHVVSAVEGRVADLQTKVAELHGQIAEIKAAVAELAARPTP